jgi:hypothetical protein
MGLVDCLSVNAKTKVDDDEGRVLFCSIATPSETQNDGGAGACVTRQRVMDGALWLFHLSPRSRLDGNTNKQCVI